MKTSEIRELSTPDLIERIETEKNPARSNEA